MHGGDLTRRITIEEAGVRRTVAETEFPLALGGPGAAIALPGVADERPAAHLGLAEARVFLQAGDAVHVSCNGTPVSSSQWLEDGDIVRIGDTRISIRVGGGRFELLVRRPEPERAAEPPVVSRRLEAGAADKHRGRRITPVEFRPRHAARSEKGNRRWIYLAVALLIPLAVASAWLWTRVDDPPQPEPAISSEIVPESEPEPEVEVEVQEPAPPKEQPAQLPREEPSEARAASEGGPPNATLLVKSDPPGAVVTADGLHRGETPLSLELPPGTEVEIELSRAGHDSLSTRQRLEPGERRELDLTLSARTGELEIRARPADAQLLVDGEPRGPADTTLVLIAVPHQIEIRKDGYESVKRSVTPRPGLSQRIDVELKTAQQIREEARIPVIRTSLGQELVLIDGGRFTMGAPRREPGRRSNETLHEVELTRMFYIATHEVSNKEFREFDENHRSGAVRGNSLERNDHPAVQVGWEQAVRFCNWLSKQDGLPPAYVRRDGEMRLVRPATIGYRLPTEAEWVWAVRYEAGAGPRKYPWGDALPVPPGFGNYGDASADGLLQTTLDGYDDDFVTTAPIDSFAPNGLGLFNTGGNVAEWMHDKYSVPAPGAGVETDPLGPEQGELYVIRGSSWMDAKVSELRLSYRDHGSGGRPDVGFRIARALE
jgi:formylglycine-generating enzyme required for sulfatase activity